jgi:multidrug efflux pump
MTLTDLSVKRPVLATVLSLLPVLVGLLCLTRLSVREMPRVEQPVVSITTTYRGASAEIVETKITEQIESAISGIEGIEKLTSASFDERSRINVEFALDRDIDDAANDIRDRLSRVSALLPVEADPPQVAKADPDALPVIAVMASSEEMSPIKMTDYLERNVIDRFSALPGVAVISMMGGRRPAMRIWIDRQALAARQLTTADIESALRRSNLEVPAGRLESFDREFTLRTETRLIDEEQFRNLIIGRGPDGYLVRLGEVANVYLAPEDERSTTLINSTPGIGIRVTQQSVANMLEVTAGARQLAEELGPSLPKDMKFTVSSDTGVFVWASIREVLLALVISVICVVVVIYAFLGSIRATLIPTVTIPISLIAAATLMYAMGYSINVLTLLAAVLAVGLVVDDAIVVLENIHRHIEQKSEKPLLAALLGSREIGFAVIATTLVLVAVFVPLAFLTGPVGRLFAEFGVTLAAMIGFSCLVALTLVPMMCSKMLRHEEHRSRFATAFDNMFRRASDSYSEMLRRLMPRSGWVIAGAGVAVVALCGLFLTLKSEGAPTQDTGSIQATIIGPEGASYEFMDRVAREVQTRIANSSVGHEIIRSSLTFPLGVGPGGDMTRATAWISLRDFSERKLSAIQVTRVLQRELSTIPDVRITLNAAGWRGLGGQNQTGSFVLQGPDYATLSEWREKLMERMAENPNFQQIDVDYQERKPQMRLQLDRNRAAELGVSIDTLGRTLETMLGSRLVTTYVQAGREYNVILQGKLSDRRGPDDLRAIYVRSDRTGELIPVANLVQIQETSAANQLNRFNRLRSVTFSVRLADGYTQGEAVEYMRNLVKTELPESAGLTFDGGTREYLRSSSELYWTFAWALVVVFLVLAAQFESYLNAIVIITTVPLAVGGALIGMFLMNMTINIYTQIGVIMLIGLAAKNGVLIVEFANQLRDKGIEYREAVVQASATRLRPVMMTSLCAAIGAIPLLLAHGPGAEARKPIGVVIVFGVVVSLLLTLVVVPAVYAVIAKNTRPPQFVSSMVERLLAARAESKPAAASSPHSPSEAG